MLWAGGEAAKPHGAELSPHRLAADADAELFARPLHKIDQTPLGVCFSSKRPVGQRPPDHAIEIRLWSVLNRSSQLCPLFIGQA